MKNINAIATIAFRDYAKFLRDRSRIVATFIFPILFVGVLGSSLQANLAEGAGYNFMAFIFTGVVGQVLFQSTAAGIISLIEDRKNDFSQELFVSPVSRYTIIIGKIVGETTVSLTQGLGVIVFGLIIGVPLTMPQFIGMAPAAIISCLLGGSFGVLVLSNLGSERSANQIFPFVIFPQFFLAGVFSPIKNLPVLLDILSKISPMRYAVDLVRGVYYAGTPEYSKIVLAPIMNNLLILFVRNERNR
jgi:ABC-2 type transport system permease protein